jgi:hypothetical protein
MPRIKVLIVDDELGMVDYIADADKFETRKIDWESSIQSHIQPH